MWCQLSVYVILGQACLMLCTCGTTRLRHSMKTRFCTKRESTPKGEHWYLGLSIAATAGFQHWHLARKSQNDVLGILREIYKKHPFKYNAGNKKTKGKTTTNHACMGKYLPCRSKIDRIPGFYMILVSYIRYTGLWSISMASSCSEKSFSRKKNLVSLAEMTEINSFELDWTWF